jgi:hypothetical protein
MSDIVMDNGLPPAEAPAEPAVEAAAAPEPSVAETVPEQPWAVSRSDWDQLVGTVQTLAGALQPALAEPAQPDIAQYAGPDGELSYDGLQRFISDQIQAGVDARLSQVEPVLNQTIAERGEHLISQKFNELKSTVGEFDTELARELAEGYASTGFQPDEAIRRGAQRAFEFAKAQRDAAVEHYKTTLSNISSAPREGAAVGAGIPDEGMPASYNGDKYKWIADNWAARNRLPG